MGIETALSGGRRSRCEGLELGVLQVGLVLRLLGESLIERRLIGPRIDFDQGIALLHHPALLEGDFDDLPSTRLRTVTVRNGCAVPSPFR